MIQRLFILAAILLSIIGCSNDDSDSNSDSNNPAAVLYDTWITDLSPLGHEGYSHSTFNSDGTYELDMAFVVAGSDCYLDVTSVGTFAADSTTVTITHESGTQAVSQCSDNEHNHQERPLTEEELDSYNATDQLSWSITGGVLTLTDGGDLTRIYTRLR